MQKKISLWICLLMVTSCVLADTYINLSELGHTQLRLAQGDNTVIFLHFKSGFHTYCTILRGRYKVVHAEQLVVVKHMFGTAINSEEALDLGFDFYVEDRGLLADAAMVKIIIRASEAQNIIISCQQYRVEGQAENSSFVDTINSMHRLWESQSSIRSVGRLKRLAHISKLIKKADENRLYTQSRIFVDVFNVFAKYLHLIMVQCQILNNSDGDISLMEYLGISANRESLAQLLENFIAGLVEAFNRPIDELNSAEKLMLSHYFSQILDFTIDNNRSIKTFLEEHGQTLTLTQIRLIQSKLE